MSDPCASVLPMTTRRLDDSDRNILRALRYEPYCNITVEDSYGEHRCMLLDSHEGDCICACCEDVLPSGDSMEPDTVAEARGEK